MLSTTEHTPPVSSPATYALATGATLLAPHLITRKTREEGINVPRARAGPTRSRGVRKHFYRAGRLIVRAAAQARPRRGLFGGGLLPWVWDLPGARGRLEGGRLGGFQKLGEGPRAAAVLEPVA